MKFRRILILAACAPALWAQVAADANAHYQTAEGRKSIAANLASPDRDATERPEELVEAMAIKPGMTVADIGTGVGYMLPYLSRAVGPSGHVLAEDIFDDFLAVARQRAADQKLANVTFIKGTETDPHLPAGGVDVILALDSYHHYNYPDQMLAGFRRALKATGRLVIVEYYKRPDAMAGGQAMRHIRLDQPDLVKEVEGGRFHLLSKQDILPGKQYLVTFARQ